LAVAAVSVVSALAFAGVLAFPLAFAFAFAGLAAVSGVDASGATGLTIGSGAAVSGVDASGETSGATVVLVSICVMCYVFLCVINLSIDVIELRSISISVNRKK
jgi:hypothetical protein